MREDSSKNKVAVIMSVYEGERAEFLDLSLKSMLSEQTYKDLSLFLAIDGSISRDLNTVIEGYIEKYPNIVIYRSQKREGLSVNLNNILIDIYKDFDYLARMDSDDISLPQRIENQIEFLKENPEVDLVGSSFIEIGDDGKKQRTVNNPLNHKKIIKYFGIRNPISHPTVMFRSRFFERANFYPVTYKDWYPVALPVEDTLFWLKAKKSGCIFANISEPLLYFRATTELIQRRGGLRMSLLEFSIRKKVIREFNLSRFYYFFSVSNLFARLLPISLKKVLWKLRQ